MTDYLQPANKIWRITCCIAAGVAAIAFLFGSAILWMGMVREWKFTFEGKPLWIGAIITTVVGIAAAFISLRLARGGSANGVTLLPTRLIQSFGILFLIAAGIVAYDKKDLPFALRSASVGVAMVLIGQAIARRKKKPNLK